MIPIVINYRHSLCQFKVFRRLGNEILVDVGVGKKKPQVNQIKSVSRRDKKKENGESSCE